MSGSERATLAALAPPVMTWQVSDRADPVAVKIADRHYNRQHVGSPQFVPPGRCVVLRTPDANAFWISSWPFAEYVKHAWPGAWVCSAFRNEAPDLYLSSTLIRQAVAATLHQWPEPPDLGMVTFVDANKTRRKRDPGRCFRKAGFRHVGFTKGGLWAFQLLPDEMPAPDAAINTGWTLFAPAVAPSGSEAAPDSSVSSAAPEGRMSAKTRWEQLRPREQRAVLRTITGLGFGWYLERHYG